MNTYEVYCKHGSFKIEADNKAFVNDNIEFYKDGKIVAYFKDWDFWILKG